MASNRLTRKPKIDTLKLAGLDDLQTDALQSFETIEFGRFDGVDLADRELSGLTLTDCELSNVTLENVEWGGSRIFDTAFTSVNAPRLAWPRTSVRNVQIKGSRIGAFDLFEGTVRSLVIEDSKLGLVNLRGSDVRDVVFRDCLIDELDLSEATVARMAFENCRVSSLEVHQAKLSDVDLRGVEIESLRHLDGLGGTTIDSDQAVKFAAHFAAHLGMRIE